MTSDQEMMAQDRAEPPDSEYLRRLRALLDQFDDLVSKQRHTLENESPTGGSGVTLSHNEGMAHLLLLQRHLVHDLDMQLSGQQTEHDGFIALQEIAATINSSLRLEQVLGQVMDAIIGLTEAERAMLLLREQKSGRLDVRVARNMDRETIDEAESFQISRSIVHGVAESGIPVVTTDARDDARFSDQESVISYGLRSILCVPLKIREEITGVVYADNRIASGIFSAKDRDLLAAFANQAAVAIENARMFEEIRENLAEMTEMKSLMDNVFASVDGGIITIDESGQVALFNRAASSILRVPARVVLSQDYIPALQIMRLPIEQLVAQIKAGAQTLCTELDLLLGGGPETITVNVTLSPLRDKNERTLGVAIVLDDITEKKRLESVRRYLPPSLVDQVRDLDAAQQPQLRTVSILFADLRGFSGYSEAHRPEQLIAVINGYFELAVQAIAHYQGFTDKFMGDAVMALFNTPLNPQEDHVLRALQTALMIQDSIAVYRRDVPAEHQLHFGIGLHTGQAVVGNVGSDLRKDYSAIGDAVNLAKRLQEAAEADKILISEAVYVQGGESVVATKLGTLKVRGRQATEQVYELNRVATL